ncbi:MAG: asparagine synthetase B family protein, partial [Bacteroidota bacterium]|nr:asparagine synthetase B family protein [Bacteroidota bacterium]
NRRAVIDYLRYQTVHGPDTLIEGVEMLPAGHLIWADDNEVRTEVWWNPAAAATAAVQDEQPWTYRSGPAATEVRDLLMDSVRLRMRSDVPFGAFLSGGIDSSSVVALMSEVGERKVATFNVAFHEDEFDESRFARMIAGRYDTDHHEIRLSADDFLESVPDALAATDHPSGDGPNTYVVSQATKKAGLTVALSGLGGDELFAGYPVFQRTQDLLDKRWAMAWPRGLRKLAGAAYRAARPGVAADKFATLLAGDRLDPTSTYPISRRVLLEPDIRKATPLPPTPDSVATWCRQVLDQVPARDLPVLSRISLAEMHTYMQHVLLRDTDQMSMAHALEVRVPFLDHRLVETALAIGDPVKFPHTPKALLTAALGDRLPREIIDRPKMGFTLPWEIWMNGPLEATCQAGLNALVQRDLL